MLKIVALQTKNQFNKMKSIYSLTLLSLLFFFSCKKEDSKPGEKQENPSFNRELMYYSVDDSSLYAIDENGNNRIRLCYIEQIYTNTFKYSKSTNKILYISKQGILSGTAQVYLSNPDGTNISQLTNNNLENHSATFSTDGSKVLIYSYSLTSDSLGKFIMMNSDGNNKTSIPFPSNISKYWGYNPNFSANDSMFIFAGYVIFQDSSRKEGLFRINTDGTNLTQILDSTLIPDYPQISPDGSKIAFVGYENRNYNIFTIDLNGTNLNKLTNFTFTFGHNIFTELPSWSEDGSKIAFASNFNRPDLSTEPDKYYEIYVMDKNGSNITQLTNDTLYQNSPVWR